MKGIGIMENTTVYFPIEWRNPALDDISPYCLIAELHARGLRVIDDKGDIMPFEWKQSEAPTETE